MGIGPLVLYYSIILHTYFNKSAIFIGLYKVKQLALKKKCFKTYDYIKKKSMDFFSFFISSNIHFYVMNALVYVVLEVWADSTASNI